MSMKLNMKDEIALYETQDDLDKLADGLCETISFAMHGKDTCRILKNVVLLRMWHPEEITENECRGMNYKVGEPLPENVNDFTWLIIDRWKDYMNALMELLLSVRNEEKFEEGYIDNIRGNLLGYNSELEYTKDISLGFRLIETLKDQWVDKYKNQTTHMDEFVRTFWDIQANITYDNLEREIREYLDALCSEIKEREMNADSIDL